MTDVQLYGHFSDHFSFGGVSRAIAATLKRGAVRFSIHEIGSRSPTYENAPWPIGVNSQRAVGIAVGYPPVARGWLQGHDHKILVTVCESSPVPRDWITYAQSCDLVVVPSKFCEETFRRGGLLKPILVLPHGVPEEWHVLPPRGPTGRVAAVDHDVTAHRVYVVRFLHVSNAVSFPQRKGTPQLLLAFKQLVENNREGGPEPLLYLKAPETPQMVKALAQLKISLRTWFLPAHSFAPENMQNLFSQFDAVIQPSRGEGFGIVPLEARCTGVPVILTKATGHADHFAEGVDTEVAVGPPTVLKTQGTEEGLCPSLTVEAVYTAMRDFIENRTARLAAAQAWAQKTGPNWKWSNVLRPLLAHLRSLQFAPRPFLAGEEDSLRGL